MNRPPDAVNRGMFFGIEFGCMQVEIEPLTTDKEEAGMTAAGLR
jgi:hypothetical protein